jgi:hypothetical protein
MAAASAAAFLISGCGHIGRLQYGTHTVSPVRADRTEAEREAREEPSVPLRSMFGDTAIGFLSGTGDSSRRYLGRLRDGFTADTLNIMVFGDNRPGFRSSRLAPEFVTIRQMFSLKPVRIVRGLITIPWALVKGLVPDLALIRDIPGRLNHSPKWGREHQVLKAMTAKIDSLQAQGRRVTAVINTGDLVEDGRYPAQWERFLRMTEPLTSRVPYFPIAGNHERTYTVEGVENWRTATGLPVGGDRLYYCFDTADGWVRIIALDSNPIVDPGKHWTREVQVKYSDEEFTWLVARVKEHRGPVIVMMHHPPFSASVHRMEWQNDAVLVERRERMVRALHDAGISMIASGHEHAYQRALLTWPDAVLISIVTGGAGAPLHSIPGPAQSAQVYGQYKVAGSVIKPENVTAAQVFNFTHLRFWFGGGDFNTYAVEKDGSVTLIDQVQIDLRRYGIPRIDQHKVPLPPAKGPKEVMKMNGPMAAGTMAKTDSTTASDRILSQPAPAVKAPRARPTRTKRR